MRDDLPRLDSLLRLWGICSRRQCRTMAAEGRITLDGVPVTDPSVRCRPDAVILLDGIPVTPAEPRVLMLNKPAGYVSVRAADTPYPPLFDLLAGEGEDLFAVGRLDAATDGLILLTNDGALCERLMRPEHAVPKLYEAELDRPIPPDASEKLTAGVILPNGTVCRPARLEILSPRLVRLRVTEGKCHEVRRLIRACGARVGRLTRLSIGPLSLDPTLIPGQWRELSAQEISSLTASISY